jgi:hypothetical protein
MRQKRYKMNANKVDRLNDEMFAPRKNYVKPLLFVAFVIILLIFGKVISGKALEVTGSGNTARFAACQNVLSIIATPHNPAGNNPHPACVPHATGNAQQTKHTSKDITAPASVEVEVIAPVVSAPAPVTVEEPTESNPPATESAPVIHPNSGRGNGSELDSSGNDIDPGNSGDKNHGGD